MKQTPTKVSTIRELIEKLGGPTKTGELFGVSPQVVVNWRARGKITPELYLQSQRELAKRGIVAPPEFWGQA